MLRDQSKLAMSDCDDGREPTGPTEHPPQSAVRCDYYITEVVTRTSDQTSERKAPSLKVREDSGGGREAQAALEAGLFNG
jgi:hypothetical protein